ncbi:SDR family oxidoreductase [Candidatus Saccharibacteria bacterium]|nr:SDR family oxidoreductase [Candidatus Saccharibacteria bacterium]
MNQQPLSELTNLSGKRAIVTGGAVGIGYGISYRLAEAGASVLIADINEDNLDEAKNKFADKNWHISYARIDVSKQEDIEKMCTKAVQEFGGIDILVNNAGIYPNISVMDLEPEEFDKVMAINVRSVFMATQAVAKQMIAQGGGGRIINITSIDALHPSMIGLAHYDASKHGVWGFTKNTALELAQHNIWVNAIAPGGIATPGTQPKDNAKAIPKEQMEAFMQKIPMHRMGDADEIGRATLFLASGLSSYMTGSQVVVDGGMLLT